MLPFNMGPIPQIGESEHTMTTNIILNSEEITTLSVWNKRAEERWTRSIADNPDHDPETLLRLDSERPHPWNGYTATPDGESHVDPIILNTHGVEPFPDNQGKVEFDLTADQLRGALEANGSFHILKQGDAWDYARTMFNVSWKKINDDWGMIDPDPSKKWITDKSQITDSKMYHVTCHGGWGYVFIHEINK